MSEVLIESFRRRFLVPEGSVPHDSMDFLHEVGDVVSALLYAELFVPDFVEIEGSVLLASINGQENQSNFREAKESGAKSLADLESSFNFIEVPYLFSNRTGSDTEDRLLGERIAVAWRGRLKCLYPGRTFVVSTLDTNVTGSVVGVHFYELRVRPSATP